MKLRSNRNRSLPLSREWGLPTPKHKVTWKNSIYTLSSHGLGDQQRAG